MAAALVACMSVKIFAQTAPAAVSIKGEVTKPFTINASTKLKQVTVKGTGHDGKEHEYTGYLLSDIITEAGGIPNNQLRGKALARYVLIKAADGYQAVIAMAEFNPEFNDKQIILADQEDGKALPAANGPYQVIIPGEKKWGRWVRMVTEIVVLTAKE